jgi:hypothetical protein
MQLVQLLLLVEKLLLVMTLLNGYDNQPQLSRPSEARGERSSQPTKGVFGPPFEKGGSDHSYEWVVI